MIEVVEVPVDQVKEKILFNKESNRTGGLCFAVHWFLYEKYPQLNRK